MPLTRFVERAGQGLVGHPLHKHDAGTDQDESSDQAEYRGQDVGPVRDSWVKPSQVIRQQKTGVDRTARHGGDGTNPLPDEHGGHQGCRYEVEPSPAQWAFH